MVEVDAVEDLVRNAKIERLGDNVPQLIKTGSGFQRKRCIVLTMIFVKTIESETTLLWKDMRNKR